MTSVIGKNRDPGAEDVEKEDDDEMLLRESKDLLEASRKTLVQMSRRPHDESLESLEDSFEASSQSQCIRDLVEADKLSRYTRWMTTIHGLTAECLDHLDQGRICPELRTGVNNLHAIGS